MPGKTVVIMVLVGLLGGILGWGLSMQTMSSSHISPRTVADYLHAVIQADRTFYTQHVVERMEAMLIITAEEQWRIKQALPLPAQFLKEASRSLDIRGASFRYRLIGLWPLHSHNKPSSKKEQTALEQVVEYGEVVEGEETINGKRYFKAIYPDRAVSRACVSCHNAHPKSAKRDFKLNDVMGGTCYSSALGIEMERTHHFLSVCSIKGTFLKALSWFSVK